MKFKNKIISLAVCLSFCLVALFNAVYFRDENIKTHETVMNKTEIDYMSLLEEFDESKVIEDEVSVKVEAVQYVDEDFFDIIDNVSDNSEIVKSEISYDVQYDKITNTFIFITIAVDKYGNETRTETVGAPFINENGEVDALFLDDEGSILLSELSDADEVNNCGFFSRLKKAIKKIAPVALVVAAVVTVAIVVAVAAPAAVAAVSTASTMAMAGGGTLTLGTAISVGAGAAATAAAGTLGAAAAVGATVGAGVLATGVAIEELTYTDHKALSTAIASLLTATLSLTMDRDYHIAYVINGSLNIHRNISLTYVEALSVLLAAGYANGLLEPVGFVKILYSNMSSSLRGLVDTLRNSGVAQNKVGIYTQLEEDAAKLAFVCGAVQNSVYQSEIHDYRVGSGYYWHFHDFAHKIHVFYGNPQ